MHELGVMIEVVKSVENFAKMNHLSKIGTLVLQIGELSPIVPHYVQACYPAAVDGTILQDTELKIEILPGNAICRDCGQVFGIVENKGLCPVCHGRNWEMLGGKEFMIKEIIAC